MLQEAGLYINLNKITHYYVSKEGDTSQWKCQHFGSLRVTEQNTKSGKGLAQDSYSTLKNNFTGNNQVNKCD